MASLSSATPSAPYRIEDDALIDVINAALHLRRPLFITGAPGTGKSSLAEAVAYELQLGRVLYWPINTKTTLKEGLYRYDAIGRLQEASLLQQRGEKEPPSIGKFITLGALGTALLPSRRPRVLLIDEIDKSEIDLPNDLLHVLDKGEFVIPELARADENKGGVEVHTDDGRKVIVRAGKVQCSAFPFILMTSNGEREFPAPFFRRCLRHDLKRLEDSTKHREHLKHIVRAHFVNVADLPEGLDGLLDEFFKKPDLAVDQLLNAVYLILHKQDLLLEEKRALLRETIYRSLSRS